MYYKGMTGTPEEGHVVEEALAYDYAKAHLDEMTDADKRTFVEFFFSGNWIEGEDDAETDF